MNLFKKYDIKIAYHRGTLDKYDNHPIIKEIVNESRNCDYIIAPIADNRMFQIIGLFVFITEKSVSQVN